jgi:uncharacterized membrane protein YcfT
MGAVTDDRAGEGMAPRVRKERLAWPDLARGACMMLVVLLHSDHALRHIGENDEHLHLLNELLVPLRQPLFFLISGMLGAGILSRGVSGVLVHRVGRYAWLYILWWALARYIHTSLDPYGPFGMDDFFMTPASLGELFRTSHDDHWFFYALAIFFGLALLLSRLPDRVHAAIALLIALPGLFDLGTRTGYTVLDWLWYYPLFAFGARRSALLWAWAPRLGQWPVLIGVGLLWALATRYAVRIDPVLGTPITAALALVAVPAGLGLAVRLATWGGPVARGLILVGRNTLPIYVLHPVVMRFFFLAFQRPEPLPRAAWVVLVTAVAVVVSWLLGRLLGRVPGLFGLPSLPARLAPARPPAREAA